MKLTEEIITSPVICYKIMQCADNSYGLKIYTEGCEDSTDSAKCYIAEDVCENLAKLRKFVHAIAESSVMPCDACDIVDEYLQFNSYFA